MRKGQFIDLTGQRFGRLVAHDRAGELGSHSMWRCKCDCGNEVVVSVSNLRNGHTRSCGCLVADANREVKLTHGDAAGGKSRLYRVWKSMRQRCYLTTSPAYKWYGGLGVKVCAEWNNSYEAFRSWALDNGYDPAAPRGKCTIDRIDCCGDYAPNNCRWTDMKTQANNKRKAMAQGGT